VNIHHDRKNLPSTTCGGVLTYGFQGPAVAASVVVPLKGETTTMGQEVPKTKQGKTPKEQLLHTGKPYHYRCREGKLI
jgi:hypothetical protein